MTSFPKCLLININTCKLVLHLIILFNDLHQSSLKILFNDDQIYNFLDYICHLIKIDIPTSITILN